MKKKTFIAIAAIFTFVFVGTVHAYWTQEVKLDTKIPMVYPVAIFAPEEEETLINDLTEAAGSESDAQASGAAKDVSTEAASAENVQDTQAQDAGIRETQLQETQLQETQAQLPSSEEVQTTETSALDATQNQETNSQAETVPAE